MKPALNGAETVLPEHKGSTRKSRPCCTDLTHPDLVSIPAAAAELGLDVKRLRGQVYRNKVGDPIGCAYHDLVFRSTLPKVRHAAP